MKYHDNNNGGVGGVGGVVCIFLECKKLPNVKYNQLLTIH
jgi:hypothetical protein